VIWHLHWGYGGVGDDVNVEFHRETKNVRRKGGDRDGGVKGLSRL